MASAPLVLDKCYCADEQCPVKAHCSRYLKHRGMKCWVFTRSPRDGDQCDMFWGTHETQIMSGIMEALAT